MKKIILISVMVLMVYVANAQEQKVIHYKKPPLGQIWHVKPEGWIITDTLAYNMPNNSKILACFNGKDFNKDSIEARLKPVLEKAVKFPENTIKIYHFNKAYYLASPKEMVRDIERRYTRNSFSMLGGIPFGLDYIAGEFTPVVGFRMAFDIHRNKSLGISYESQTFFKGNESKIESIDTNWFLNLEYGFTPWHDKYVNNNHIVQLGYLVKNRGGFYTGNTYKLSYRYTLKRNGNLQMIGGFIATDSFDKTFPYIGIRLF